MTEQAVETRYLTVAQLAERLGVGKDVVYRNVASGRWKVSRTGDSPKAPIRVSPAQVAAIEELMELNGQRDVPQRPVASQRDVRTAQIQRGLRRLQR